MRRQAVALAGSSLLVACGGPGAASSDDNTAGMGVPQQRAAVEYPGDRRALEARVHVAGNGCFLGSLPDTGGGRRYLVVWPAGSEQGSSGDVLLLPDGTTVHDRDLLEGRGTVMPIRRLEGFGTGGYWDATVAFCAPGAPKVLVLDSATGR